MTEFTKPLCVAPWTNILIDTNKGVKPCCAYMDQHLGDLKNQEVADIINGKEWLEVKRKLSNHEWPLGCYKGCKESEDRTGWSPRLNFQIDHFQHGQHEYDIINYESNKIIYMEFNGSNICNLACLHCNPIFSSKWHVEWKKLGWDNTEYHNTLSNTELIEKNLKQLDLSNLKFIHFKGGEPMLNDETLCVLEYVNSLGILGNLKVTIFTNGSIYNERLIELLGKAKSLQFSVSIDGTSGLFEYVRYGEGNIEKIEKLVSRINELENSILAMSVSTMAYNIFDIVNIRDLWMKWRKSYKFVPPFFNIIVTGPEYLNVCVLSDNVRKELISHLTKYQLADEFNVIINALSNDYLGDEMHNRWVDYTKKMESMRGNNILDLVPELKDELVYR